jgi:hypothetical protein
MLIAFGLDLTIAKTNPVPSNVPGAWWQRAFG